MTKISKPPDDLDRLDAICKVFLRMVALMFIIFTIRYWLQIIGYYEGENFRFDTMPDHWKAAVAVLGVIHPITALGLWGVFSWGVVVWFVAMAIELVMHYGYPQLYGQAESLVWFHISCMATYAAFRLIRFAVSRRLDAAARNASGINAA